MHEPVHRFRLGIPTDAAGAITRVLAGLAAVPHKSAPRGDACVLDGEIPAARVHELQRRLRR